MTRAMIAAVILLGIGAQAKAGPAHCFKVRWYVAIYGQDAAESWARNNGYSEADIVKARACLKPRPRN